jgi:hypothetical protein
VLQGSLLGLLEILKDKYTSNNLLSTTVRMREVIQSERSDILDKTDI